MSVAACRTAGAPVLSQVYLDPCWWPPLNPCRSFSCAPRTSFRPGRFRAAFATGSLIGTSLFGVLRTVFPGGSSPDTVPSMFLPQSGQYCWKNGTVVFCLSGSRRVSFNSKAYRGIRHLGFAPRDGRSLILLVLWWLPLLAASCLQLVRPSPR